MNDYDTDKPRRTPLCRERELRAAIAVADSGGLESLTRRRVGQHLGVEAMSLYKHVANKVGMLDGIVDLVMGEIALPSPNSTGRRRCASGPRPLVKSLLDTRGPSG